MHLTSSVLAALVATIAGANPITSPIPIDIPVDMVQPALSYLDGQGMVNWTLTEDGDMTTTVHHSHLLAAYHELPGPEGVGERDIDFTESLGHLGDYAAWAACGGGVAVKGHTVEESFKKACKQLVAEIPHLEAAEQVWRFYKKAAPLLSGKKGWINYGFLFSSKSSPSLTDHVCDTVFEELSNKVCVGENEATTGGIVELVKDHAYTLLSLIPELNVKNPSLPKSGHHGKVHKKPAPKKPHKPAPKKPAKPSATCNGRSRAFIKTFQLVGSNWNQHNADKGGAEKSFANLKAQVSKCGSLKAWKVTDPLDGKGTWEIDAEFWFTRGWTCINKAISEVGGLEVKC